MPTWWSIRGPFRRWCERSYRWSTMRGGCRFEPNHAGDCKPGRVYGAGI